jgi:hypothetical protein
MGKKAFTSLENCTNLFAALTEFRREAKQKFEPVRKNKAYMKKGVFDAEKYFTQLLKEHNIDRNYISHIKEVLHKDELITRTFSKWNDQKDKPNMEMVARVAEEAAHRLSAYQREWRKRKKAKTADVPQPACFTEDIFNVTEESSHLLEDVEIVNPQIMEDDVLDGYNEVTGEFDKLPEVYLISKPSERDIFKGLSDDDLIEELLRRHPKAEGVYIKWR